MKNNKYISFISFSSILFFTVCVACMYGSVDVPFSETINVLKYYLLNISTETLEQSNIYIVWNLRVPRIILGFVVGGSLAISGVAMQSITRNVMADPFILGISSGALSFVSIGFLVGGSLVNITWFIPLLAFLGALFALIIVIIIGGFSKDASPVKLILAGSAVSITLNAIGQLGIYFSDSSNKSNSVVMWMMGSLASARWNNIIFTVITSIIGIIFFTAFSRAFDLISLGDETAISLGANVTKIKRISLVVVAIIAGVSVASCGIIGLVGFIIPHITRFLFGAGHRKQFPLAFFFGGIFLIWMDLLARTILSPVELPVGVFTSLCGGPYFIWMLRRRK